jgi:hypothetical protein
MGCAELMVVLEPALMSSTDLPAAAARAGPSAKCRRHPQLPAFNTRVAPLRCSSIG